MSARVDAYAVAPDLTKAMMALEKAVQDCGLDKTLCELVKIRASQINGCGYCLHMHTQDARRRGEAEERLHLVAAWRESSYFSEREQAALAWTESLTRIAETGAPEPVYERLSASFSEAETAEITFLVMAINAWNRLAVGLRFAHPIRWRAA